MYGYSCRLDNRCTPMSNRVQSNQQSRLNHSFNYPSELHRIIPTLRPDLLAILVK